VLMRCVNGPPSAEAAELLGLLGATGFENGVAQNVIVSRSRAAAVDAVELFEMACARTASPREPSPTVPPWAGCVHPVVREHHTI
jgi:hypothetical protein